MHKAREMDGIGLVRVKWSTTEFRIFSLDIRSHSVTTPTMWRTVDSYDGTLGCLGSEFGFELGWEVLVSMVSAFSSSHCLLALSTRSLLRSLCMSERLA